MGVETRNPTDKPDSPWNKKSIVNRRLGDKDLSIDETPSLIITQAYFPENQLDSKDVIGIPSFVKADRMNHKALPPAGSANRFYAFNLTRFHAVHVN